MARLLEPAQQHDRNEIADVKARRGRVEADVAGHDLPLRQRVERRGIGDLMDVAALVEQLEEGGAVGRHAAAYPKRHPRESGLPLLAEKPIPAFAGMTIGGAMQLNLLPHPTTPPAPPEFKVWANVDYAGALGAAATAQHVVRDRRARLAFRHSRRRRARARRRPLAATCLEAFLRRSGGEEYREWNFAPSGQWAAYDFSAYREGMTNAEIEAPPYIRMEDNLTWWTLGATIAVDAGLQWDLNSRPFSRRRTAPSPTGRSRIRPGKPDFHAPDCFAAKLP